MAEMKKKLPKCEWDFSGLEPSLATYAFFYEYSRQSEKIRKIVEVYRELIPYRVCYDLEHDWSFATEKIKHLSKEEEQILYAKTDQLKVNDYLSLICWLGYCEKFPDTPFLKLAPEDYINGPQVSINSERFFPVNGRGFCDIGYCLAKDFDFQKLNLNLTLGALEPMSLSEGEGNHASYHMIRVEWWKSDGELKEEFTEWLDVYRRFLKVKAIPPSKRGLLNRALELPKECKKTSTALVHLGKLRCLEASGTWEKYMDAYHMDKSDQRSLAKDVSAARKIIAWLEEKV